jgi:hypothetical protein
MMSNFSGWPKLLDEKVAVITRAARAVGRAVAWSTAVSGPKGYPAVSDEIPASKAN